MARPFGIFPPAAAWLCAVLLALLAPAGAAPARVAADLDVAVRRLASDDPRDRQAARRELLHAEVEDLDTIARAAAALDRRQKALPELRRTLEEVVHQATLRRAKQEYITSDEAVFFEERPPAFFGIQLFGEEFAERMLPGQVGPGVTVASAIPGFNAYEYFEEGDVILAARLDPEEEFETVYNLVSLSNILESVAVEELVDFRRSVILEVLTLRAGRLINVPFRLDIRVVTTDAAFVRSQQRAQQQADDVWETEFAPLFSGSPSDA